VIDGLIITVTDIQRLKEAQQHMADGRVLFEDILTSLPIPLVLLDQSLRIVVASVEFARRFGTTEPNVIGKQLSELGSGWRHPEVTTRLETLTRGEPCPPFRLHGNLGAPLPVDVIVHPRRLRASRPGPRYLFLMQEAASVLPAAINVD
jgi:PAS domain-containing protein